MDHDHKLKGLKEIKNITKKRKKLQNFFFLRNIMSVKLDMEEKLIEEMKNWGKFEFIIIFFLLTTSSK